MTEKETFPSSKGARATDGYVPPRKLAIVPPASGDIDIKEKAPAETYGYVPPSKPAAPPTKQQPPPVKPSSKAETEKR